MSLACATLLGACASAGVSGAQPQTADGLEPVCVDEECPVSDLGSREAQALPRYFTIRLVGTDTLVSGQPLMGKELSGRISQEAGDPRNDGAAVITKGTVSGEALGALIWELSGAGFDHIVISESASAEVLGETAAAAEEAPSVSERAESVRPPAEPSPVVAVSEPAQQDGITETEQPAVIVKNIGLHVGGGPNDDVTKAFFSEPIEQKFADFRRCHALVDNPSVKASVGVDLLIGTRGGQPDLKDFRTVLRGKKFKECVAGVFRTVRFKAPVRPTMISYSLLFKPQ